MEVTFKIHFRMNPETTDSSSDNSDFSGSDRFNFFIDVREKYNTYPTHFVEI